MKILYLHGKYSFCYYYRGYLPAAYSNQMALTDFIGTGEPTKVEKILEYAQKADVVVLQRPQEKKIIDLVLALKRMGKKVIFENDDTYLVGKGIPLERLENDAQRKIAQEMSDTTNTILSMCDGAIASTQVLADEYSKINPNVVVLKNCIDPYDAFKCKDNTTGKFRIGFIGSVTTNDDYLHIKDQIKKLDERDDITIVVFGIKYKDGSNIPFMKEDLDFWNSLKNVEWQNYVPVKEYMYTISKLALDLVIIPRKDSYFNRCKSNLKFLEMSLLEIPVLAQGFKDGTSPYQYDKDYMSIVVEDNAWYNEIINIKDNYSKYKELAKKARAYVLENYNIKSYALEWTKQIEKLCK